MWPAIIAAAASALSSMKQQGGQQKQNFALSGPSYFDQQQQAERQQGQGQDPYASYTEEDPYGDVSELRRRAAQRFLSGS